MSAQTVDVASRVRGELALDDPAETFHEASRLDAGTIGARMSGSARLGADPLLQATARRASRRHTHRPYLDLETPRLPTTRLRTAILQRRSRAPEPGALRLRELSALLAAAYASAPTPVGARRPVPSAGALYPLELYVVALAVDGVAGGVHHYDPYRHGLELIDAREAATALAEGVFDPAPLVHATAVVVTTAVFPRAMFKYGQRGYRFALLEAGHVAQNLVLAAAALRLHALPYGGFFDRRIDALLDVDGVDECCVNMLVLGGRS